MDQVVNSRSEGPSDRIYIRHWLNSLSPDGTPEFVEGIDYAIMFYGGRLLSHLSPIERVEDFIALCHINRHVAVIMDRDKDDDAMPINATKKRIVDDLAINKGFSWVTAGREVENYVDHQTLCECVEQVRPGFGKDVSADQYANPLPKDPASGRVLVDKVAVAHAVSERKADLNKLDLAEKIAELASFIRAAQ